SPALCQLLARRRSGKSGWQSVTRLFIRLEVKVPSIAYGDFLLLKWTHRLRACSALCLCHDGVEGRFGSPFSVEQQRGAETPPGVSIRDTPECDQLNVLTMFQENSEQVSVLVCQLLIGGLNNTSSACLGVLRHIGALAALAALRGVHVQFCNRNW